MSHILLFYSGSKLALLKGSQETQRIFQTRDLPLAEAKAMGAALAAVDHGHTPAILESSKARQSFAFTPFGHICTASSMKIGFAGERLDRASGCYLLGAGYRSYSPALMRFQSPDTQSPFLRGGINAYAYCSSDPVNYSDPSGRFKWFRKIINSISGHGRGPGPASAAPNLPSASGVTAQSLEATRTAPHPPTYFGFGEPPPPYDLNARFIDSGTRSIPYSATPLKGESVIEIHDGNIRAVRSLIEHEQATSQANNPRRPAAAALRASNALVLMSKNNLPLQTDNGIREAVRTAQHLYDINRAGTTNASDPTQSLPLAVGITRRT